VPADEFRQHYASLSEEGLREIDRDDLTEVARACYDEELARRGLKIGGVSPPVEPSQEEAPQVEASQVDIAWVPLDTFSLDEVELARALLDAEQIPTRVERSSAGNYPPSPGGLVLFVPKPFLEQAREVLAAEISDEELAAEAEAYKRPDDA
jgi:hypothetical protein